MPGLSLRGLACQHLDSEPAVDDTSHCNIILCKRSHCKSATPPPATVHTQVATGTTTSWHLDRMEVTCGSAPTATFPLKDWLRAEPTGSGPASITKTIRREMPQISLKLNVVTSDVEEASFDGDVFITLTGLDGVTEEVQLVNDAPAGRNFQRSGADTFTINVADVGALRSMNVRPVSGRAASMMLWQQSCIFYSCTPAPAPASAAADGCGVVAVMVVIMMVV